MPVSRLLFTISISVLCLVNNGIAYSRQLPQETTGSKGSLIKGTVTDSSTHLPVELATLALTGENGAIIQTASSSKDGGFAFNVADKGKYVLRISFIGYKSYTSGQIHVTGPGTVDLGRIRLQHTSGMLNEVVVKSRKALIQHKGDKLIYNASADISNKAGSATDVLRKAPMVTVGADGEVKMRGNSNIKVLLNGLPSGILARNLKEALKLIPASTIESVEVITTPSAKYEAEGAAGVINIVTKKKMKGTSGNIDLSAGNLEQSVNGGLNIARGKFNFNISLNTNREKERNVSELKRLSLKDGKQTGELLQRTDDLQKSKGTYGDLTTEFRPDSTQKLGFTASFWNGQWPARSSLYNFYKSNLETTEYNQKSKQGGKFSMVDLSFNYQKKFRRRGQEFQFISQYSKSDDASDYVTDQYDLSGRHVFSEQSPNKGGSNDLSFQVDYAHPLSKPGKQLLETGVRYARNNATSAFTVFNNRNNPGNPVVEDPSRSDKLTYFQYTLATYLSIQLETRNNWTFRSGLRYENTSLGGEFKGASPSFKASFGNFVPGMLIMKKLNDQHEVKLNYTERIRRPWIWDLNPYVNASDPRNLTFGNPQLRPEITRMLEAGHAYSGQSGFILNSSIYFNSNSNAIESLTTVDSLGISRTTSRNIAANRRLGTNLNAYTQINPNWTLNAGAELNHVWFKSKALDVQNDAGFYSLNINTSYTLPADYAIQASADYSNGYVTLQGKNTANYTYRFSARKEFPDKRASLTLDVHNPFQKTFLQRSYTTAPTFQGSTTSRFYNRSFTLSLSWQFGSIRSVEDTGKRFPEREERPVRESKRGR